MRQRLLSRKQTEIKKKQNFCGQTKEFEIVKEKKKERTARLPRDVNILQKIKQQKISKEGKIRRRRKRKKKKTTKNGM